MKLRDSIRSLKNYINEKNKYQTLRKTILLFYLIEEYYFECKKYWRDEIKDINLKFIYERFYIYHRINNEREDANDYYVNCILHDIKNPLLNISKSMETVKKKCYEINDHLKSSCRSVIKQVNNLEKQINVSVDTFLYKDDKNRNELKQVDIKEVCIDSLNICQ